MRAGATASQAASPTASPTALYLSLLALGALAGCTGKDKSEDAPRTQSELTLALLTDFETEDLPGIVTELLPYAEDAAADETQYEMEPPALSTLDDMTFSANVTESGLIGAALARRIGGGITGYAEAMAETDQQWADPAHYESWTRSIVEGDAAAFGGGEGTLRTDNQTMRIQSMWKFPYNTRKDYTWVDADGTQVIAFRTWLYEEGHSDDEVVKAIGCFQAEFWAETDNGLIWFAATWAETITPIGDEEFLRNEIADSLVSYIEATESHVTGG